MNGKQTTTSSNAPWDAAQPALKTGLADAETLYKSGVGGQVYTGSTVVPYANQTMQGFGDIQNNASANMGGQGLSGQYQGIIDSGGYNAPQQQAMQGWQQQATGAFDPNSNPAFQQVLKQSQDAARDYVDQGAASAGRYGSGIHQQTMGNTIGDLTSRMVGNEYQNWQNRGDAARQNMFSGGQTAQGNLGAAYQGMGAPAQDMITLGGAYEDLATRQMNDQLRIFDAAQNNPWDQLGRLNAVASGSGQYGTSTTTAPGPNPFAQAVGGGLSLLSLLGG